MKRDSLVAAFGCWVGLAAVLAAIGASTLAVAEEIEEVIVKGEKINRSVQDTASSVGVLTEQQLENSPIYDINDAFDRIANVNGAEGNEGFTIRGINNRAVGAAGTSGFASLSIDGAFISETGIRAGQKDLWDIAQVEVFRGPQSTNQGRNALAGAIFIRSQDPTYTPDARYRMAYGSDNTQVISAAFGDAIVDQELAFRIAIDDQRADGFVTNEILADDEYGGTHSTTVRGKLLYEPGFAQNMSVLTTLSYSKNESGDGFSSLIDEEGNAIDPFQNRNFANIDGFENLDQSIATVEVDLTLNEVWSLTSVSSWNKAEYERQDDADRQATGGIIVRTRPNDTTTLSQELRLNFDTSEVQGNIGLYYFDQQDEGEIADIIDEDVRTQIVQILPITAPQLAPFATDIASLYPDPLLLNRNGTNDRDIENWAVYGNVSYDINHLVTLFVGLRYDNEEVRNTAAEERTLISDLPDPAMFPTPLDQGVAGVNNLVLGVLDFTPIDNQSDYSAFLPKLGVTLNWSDDLNTSFTVQRAYRAGGSGTNSQGNFEFDPEYTINYDLALRSQWFDQRLTVNANAFYVDWSDQQIAIREANSPSEFRTVNAGQSKLKGAELEINALIGKQLELYSALGYVETEFTEFELDVDLGGDDYTGNEFSGAPQKTVSVGALVDVTDQLKIQMDLNYQQASFDSADNRTKNDSRTIVNSKVTYHLNDAVEVALIGRNLFEKEYILLSNVANDNIVYTGQPRTLPMQLQGRF